MKRFILSIPDDLADRIEAYRVRLGMKSTAEAHRALIYAALGSYADYAPKVHERPRPLKEPTTASEGPAVSVPVLVRRQFNPQPKSKR